MELKEILESLKKFEGTDEYKQFVDGLFTPERVKAFLDTSAGQQAMQPYIDRQFNKGLETWKTNNLQGLVNAEVKKRFPDADPKDVEIANIKAQLEAVQRDAARKELLIKAQSIAAEKKLPASLIGFFVGEDEKATTKNIDVLEKAFTEAVSTSVDARLKGDNHVPNNDKGEPMDGVTAAFLQRNPDLKI